MPLRKLKYAGIPVDLKKNEAHNFANNYAINIYRKKAIYTMIPKNLCSTLRYSIAISNGIISKNNIKWIHFNNFTFNPSLKDIAEADYTFVVLRCPFRRLVSCFLDKIVDKKMYRKEYLREKSSIFRKFPKKIQNKMFSIFDNPKDINFSNFVESLKDIKHNEYDIHWRPQIDFLLYDNYDDYFAFENFKDTKNILLRKIDLDIYDARNLTKHGNNMSEPIEGDFQFTNCDEISILKKSNKMPIYECFYNDKIKNDVLSIYKNDFELYLQKFGQKNLLFNI